LVRKRSLEAERGSEIVPGVAADFLLVADNRLSFFGARDRRCVVVQKEL
jgi:hypothetical protein